MMLPAPDLEGKEMAPQLLLVLLLLLFSSALSTCY